MFLDFCVDSCIDMCMDMCLDDCIGICRHLCRCMHRPVCEGISTDMCTDARIGMGTDVFMDMCIDASAHMCIDVRIAVLEHVCAEGIRRMFRHACRHARGDMCTGECIGAACVRASAHARQPGEHYRARHSGLVLGEPYLQR